MIQVYYASPSIYGRKVLAVLEEKELDYEIKKMSFAAKEHLQPEYLKLNPNGEIPTLVDDNEVIYESTAIIEYLNDEYPEPPLLPEDSAGRARVRIIEDYCDLHFYPALVHCLIKKKYQGQELDEKDLKSISECISRIESYLGNQEWVAGKFSLADCAVMTALATMEALEIWNLAANSKSISNYMTRLKKRKGFKGASLFNPETVSSAS